MHRHGGVEIGLGRAHLHGDPNDLDQFARIRADNEKSIKLAARIGFKEEGRLRQGFGDVDALVFGLLRDDFYGLCRQPPESP